MLELAEEALDQVALAIKCGIDRTLDFAVFLGGDMGLSATRRDQIDNGLGIVTTVGDQSLGRRKAIDQGGDGGLVRGLSGREYQAQRQTVLIDHGIDLRAQSSTRTADGVILTPFLPPAAC